IARSNNSRQIASCLNTRRSIAALLPVRPNTDAIAAIFAAHAYSLLFAIGNRKSKIETVIVPVVQRIERRFPKAKMSFLQESPNDVRSTQFAVFEVVA